MQYHLISPKWSFLYDHNHHHLHHHYHQEAFITYCKCIRCYIQYGSIQLHHHGPHPREAEKYNEIVENNEI